MFELIRRSAAILFAGVVGLAGAASAQPAPSGDPPARVGRLAYLQGTVSFHDRDQSDWAPAVANRPISSGDALWTEPNARSELSIAGTRVRMDSGTQLDMLALDDSRTRMQLDQGRLDIKTINYDTHQPYEVITPRGTIALEQQGDYYVEAGTTDDPTRLGVRQGAAQFQAPDGRVLAVRANEVVEITGDGSSMELHTIEAPPPPMPQYWAERDRMVVYDQPPQYLSSGVTGYEDLNAYGTWQNDPQYGEVWYVRDAPSGWAPYTTGRWISDPVYGWTWVDEQPWGFAPYHYGRWAQRDNRWFWVPPERSQPAVYAPALVAFVGGTELGIALGQQSRAPVGWFPLGPREVYVPPYTTDRDYYRRVNVGDRVQAQVMDNRWQQVQRHEAIQQNWMNRRFATVVPAQDFARSQPVERVALRVAPEKMATVPVAAVAVPPSPTVSVRAVQAPTTATAPGANQPPRPDQPPRSTAQGPAGANTSAQARPTTLQAIKPEPQTQKAPGPQIAARTGVTTGPTTGVTANTAAKPALPKLEPRNASAPPLPQIQGERKPATTQPGPKQATAPSSQPAAPAKPGEPPKPGQPQATQPQHQATPQAQQPPKPGEPSHAQPPAQASPPPLPPRQGQAEPPKPQAPAPAQTHAAPVAPPPAAHAAPPPQQSQAPTPPPVQHQAAPTPPPQQAHVPTPPPVQHQAAPTPPPQQAHVPTPPPVQHQAAPTPPPQAAHPAPAPQAPPQQAHAPAPPPPQAAHPAPPPPQQHQQAQQPAPKQEEKKQQ